MQDVLHSPDHANLEKLGSTRTKNFNENENRRSSAVAAEACSDDVVLIKKTKKQTKPKILSNTDVLEFLVTQNIKTENELMLVAKQCHDDGEKDIYNFIMNKTPKALIDLVSMHNMENAKCTSSSRTPFKITS